MNNPVINEIQIEDVSVEDALKCIRNVTKWDEIREEKSKVKSTKQEPGVGDYFKWNAGGVSIKSTITESEAQDDNAIYAWKGRSLIGLLNAHHRWIITKNDDGVIIRVEEEMSGPLKFLVGDKALSEGNQKWLNEIKRFIEDKPDEQ